MKITKRFAHWVLKGLGRRRWGFPPRIVSAVIDQLGPLSALWWMLETMSSYEKARAQLGPLRTHLLVTGASLLYGSSYCAYSHAYALQLLYFERTGRLFPLDEHELTDLRGLGDYDLRVSFDQLLRDADLREEIPFFDRMVALATGQSLGHVAEDDHILHLVHMFEVLSFCSERARVKPDRAHDPIAKDELLVARYQQARSHARIKLRRAA